MEMKVWMDGYQRVVCGVTEQTTCQDVMVALAHASGKTGRFTMFEKWRTNERCLSPADFPLLVLQKWGEYSSDVQLILRHASVASGRKHRAQPVSGRLRRASNPPEHAPVKKSLTFSGAHRRASSAEQPAASNGRVEGGAWNVSHSVESSEQSSIASQSSTSLSPYMSLERQTRKTDKTLSNDDFDKDFNLRPHHSWLPNHLKQNSDDRTSFANAPAEEKSSKAGIPPPQNNLPRVPRSQPPLPSARSSKLTTVNTEVRSQIPKPALRKETLPPQIRQQNGNVELEKEQLPTKAAVSSNAHVVLNSPVCSNKPNTAKAIASSPVSSKPSLPPKVSSSVPNSRDKIENLVTNTGPKVFPSKLAVVKQALFSRSFEERNSPRKETEKSSEAKETSRAEPGLRRMPPVAAKRHRPVAVDPEGVTPSRTDSDPTVTPSVEPVLTSRSAAKQTPGAEDAERLKEAQERKELIELIGKQEREMLVCESHLKDLNHEISLLEGDLEVDESKLESQMRKIEELEAAEKQLEEELMELELVSWEDKLILERQKENRIRTEILLLQSSIAKSETEIHSVVEKIRSLTMKTEEATEELDRFLEEKREKENKEIENLELNLREAVKQSEASVSRLKSLELEILASDQSLSKKKMELLELEGQLKKLNLELFLQEPREIASTRRSRTPVLERPGSSRRLQRCQLSPSPLRLNQTIDETNRPALGYIV